MPSDLQMKTMNGVHRVALRLTGGRFGWNLLGMPVVELTTTGRKSGQPRAVMLTSPLQEGSTFVVVASRGGDDNPPAWLLNIEASGDVQVATNGEEPQPYHARVATAEERARMWPRLTADHKNYAGYQKKTSREIPLVLLTPA
ncbi:MAG: nitroreductase [Frankiales bacterium]|nr:nitroreductase [Frankiales bacterium]